MSYADAPHSILTPEDRFLLNRQQKVYKIAHKHLDRVEELMKKEFPEEFV